MALELVSTSGDSPVTVTDSAMAPISSRTSTSAERPTSSLRSRAWYLLKPVSSARIS